jgi:hypothetical protein
MAREKSPGQGQLLQHIGRTGLPAIFAGQSQLGADLRSEVIAVGPAGFAGWFNVQSVCNPQIYKVQNPSGQNFRPGTKLTLGNAGGGFGTEFIIGVAAGQAGASDVSVSTSVTFGVFPVTAPPIPCPPAITGKSYLAFAVATRTANWQTYNDGGALVTGSSSIPVLWANLYADGVFASTIQTMPPLGGVLWAPGGIFPGGPLSTTQYSSVAGYSGLPVAGSVSRIPGSDDAILFASASGGIGGGLVFLAWFPRAAFQSPFDPHNTDYSGSGSEFGSQWQNQMRLFQPAAAEKILGPICGPGSDTVYYLACTDTHTTDAGGEIWSCQLFRCGSPSSFWSFDLSLLPPGAPTAVGSPLVLNVAQGAPPQVLAITATHAVVQGARMPIGGGTWVLVPSDLSGSGNPGGPVGCGLAIGPEEIAALGNCGVLVTPGALGNFGFTPSGWGESGAMARTASGAEMVLYPLAPLGGGPPTYYRLLAIDKAPPGSCPITPLTPVFNGPDGGSPLAFMPRT